MCKPVQRTFHKSNGPALFKNSIRREVVGRFSEIAALTILSLPRQMGLPPAALGSLRLFPLISQKVLHRREQEGAEFAPRRIREPEIVFIEQTQEEFLR